MARVIARTSCPEKSPPIHIRFPADLAAAPNETESVPNRHTRRTKIVCTLGPASSNREQLHGLMEAGLNVARLNFSHGTHDQHLTLINTVREVAQEVNCPVAILGDLQGPRIRVGDLAAPVTLHEGSDVVLVYEDEARAGDIPTTYAGLATDVHVGDRILLDDGLLELMVLDVMLPVLSGFEVCRRVRSQSSLPILMLTARTAEVDRVLGLEAGADDYILKPFSMPELVGRVRAMLRRRELDRQELPADVLRVGDLEVDVQRRVATIDGRSIQLTNSEFRLLVTLAERPGHVLSRRELMQHLWASDHVGDEHACEVHISNLRRKIERDPTQPERLVTVRGSGYKLVPA